MTLKPFLKLKVDLARSFGTEKRKICRSVTYFHQKPSKNHTFYGDAWSYLRQTLCILPGATPFSIKHTFSSKDTNLKTLVILVNLITSFNCYYIITQVILWNFQYKFSTVTDISCFCCLFACRWKNFCVVFLRVNL